ncbi:amino acid adenylation domain-containing protein [Alteromonas sp. 76-1]|uniref:non-ribosomal peptide synthetase n=1 Tax=Alteromonas sp. 76-1 TaxID=2358187 RepID=UPI000FD183FE|nr:non-ribosomal peptide synthetase [Alteromonas sp. 76-1]VEL98334.1 amino acid adenylation domain-containing protein [Alteromonas sp. 76-1]
MNAIEILTACREAGITVTLLEQQLKLSFNEKLPDSELISRIKAHKDEIIQIIRKRTDTHLISDIKPLNYSKPVIASLGQKRLWMLSEMSGSNHFYNMIGAFKIKGQLQFSVLEQALQKLVHKHQALRTFFYEEQNTLIQSVGRVYQPLIENRFVSSDSDISSAIDFEQHESFDLTKGQLFRARLLSISDDTTYLILNVHHIAADGTSVDILLSDLSSFYNTYLKMALQTELTGVVKQNKEVNDKESGRLQYTDFSRWQQANLLPSSKFKDDITFYEKHLSGISPVHNFPLDFPRATKQNFDGDSISNHVDSALHSKVDKLAKQQNVTLYTLLITAFSVLLYRYSQQKTIVLGTPTSGRLHKDLEQVVGFFVNTQVFRCEVDGRASFADLLKKNAHEVNTMLAHQSVPFETLVERLQPSRSLSVHPLFQMMFTLIYKKQSLQFADCEIEDIDSSSKIAKFDLDLTAVVDKKGLLFKWNYNNSLFSSKTIERLTSNYLELLNSVVNDYHTAVDDLEIISESEQTLLVEYWGKGPEYHIDVSHVITAFESFAHKLPEQLAVVGKNRSYTYAELDKKANQLANLLIEKGLSFGDKVAIYLERSIECIVSILAILKAGAAFIGIDPSYPSQRVSAVLNDSQAKFCIASSSLSESAICKVILLKEFETLNKYSPLSPNIDIKASDIAYMIYTSGSTGNPKGIKVTHGNLVNLLTTFANLSDTKSTHSGSWWTSISFDVSIYEIFCPLYRGATFFIANDSVRNDGDIYLDWVQENQINNLYLHFGYLGILLERLKRGHDFNFLRFILVGVEPISYKLLREIKHCLPNLTIVNGYGPSEATVCSTVFPVELNQSHYKTTPIGRPVGNTVHRVLDENMKLVPVGVVGELYIGGDCLSNGYHDSDLNQGRFIKSNISANQNEVLYRTGDLVRYLQDGQLEFVSRKDNQIKLRGYRIEPGEVEHALIESRDVIDSKVVVQVQEKVEYLVAFVVLSPSSLKKNETITQCSQSLRLMLMSRLPEYMVPSFIVAIDEMPLTTNGKVDIARLPELNIEDFKQTFVNARTDLEATIVAQFQQILSVQNVGIKDEFFNLGGHSLLATRLISALNSKFECESVQLTLKDLFENSTPEKIALLIEKRAQNERIIEKERQLLSLNKTLEEGVL